MKAPAAEWVATKDLVPWTANPRSNDKAAKRLAAFISSNGGVDNWGAPVLARTSTREVIAGHTRLKAAEILGIEQVPVRYIDVDERTAHKMALADNRLGELAEWELPQLAAILSDYGLDEVGVAGWDSMDLEKLAVLAPGLGEEGKEYSEADADDVKVTDCPHCGGEVPL